MNLLTSKRFPPFFSRTIETFVSLACDDSQPRGAPKALDKSHLIWPDGCWMTMMCGTATRAIQIVSSASKTMS